MDKQKILIVDDKPANLFSLEQILKETGALIIRAESGNEALAASLNHDFALALLDVQMPGMDGYELAEWLRSEEKSRDLPIIFISAVYSSDYHVFKGYDAGAVDFMVKPYNQKILLSKVRVFLELGRQKDLLKQSGEWLALANDTLETRVRERTRELETAVHELKTEIERRKAAEAELKKSKKEWQDIFEAIGQMTIIVDRDHTIVAANRAVLGHTGLTLEGIVGQKCFALFHKDNQATQGCPVSAMKASGEYTLTESEIEILGKTCIVSCTPVLDDTGQLDKIIHISTDITRQKQLKKELIQAHKMEAIGSLAGGIAHDFNNILSAVLGFTDLSLKSVEAGSQLEEDLTEVYAAGLRAKELVKQILNFARKTDEQPKPVRIDLIAKEVAKFLRSTIPATIDIRTTIDSSTLVLANPIKIHQLIMNLCTNAAYAMNDAGILEISLQDVVLETADLKPHDQMEPGLYQRLQISDTGCGIPPDIIDSIFLPFFTTKGIHEGTGMGLAMVHSIVKECGGDVSVQTRVGKGTVFTVLLPATQEDQPLEKVINGDLLGSGHERILIVDDEPAICKLASRMLEGAGYTVVSETDSESALALFAARPDDVNLVVTDMTMPNLAGDELTRKILAIRPDMPVIIATGYSRRMSDPTALELGARAMLSKPFEKTSLLKTVRTVLDSNQRTPDEH
ncbi:MAG: response regulator [Pseudomonadota bacterium]